MKLQEYRTFLQGQGSPDDAIKQQMMVVGDFVKFLQELGPAKAITTAGKGEAEQFARRLIDERRNTLENFSALCKYADWLGHRQLYVALIELMDCHSAMAVLADEIEERHGQEVRGQIFREVLPPLGANETERCAHTRTIMERMAGQISPEEMRAAWYQVQHGIPVEAWRKNDMAEKEKFHRCGSIDEFLSLKRQERDAFLIGLRDEGKLWYTVEITDEVLDFIKSDPEMEVGRQEGDRIYITKVPYNAVRYLHETDPKMKRYYVCHCPMLREAIRREQPISPDVCECSLGHASHYLAGLGQELKGEVLESAVKGDTRCRFVFYLPNKDNQDGNADTADQPYQG